MLCGSRFSSNIILETMYVFAIYQVKNETKQEMTCKTLHVDILLVYNKGFELLVANGVFCAGCPDLRIAK